MPNLAPSRQTETKAFLKLNTLLVNGPEVKTPRENPLSIASKNPVNSGVCLTILSIEADNFTSASVCVNCFFSAISDFFVNKSSVVP